MIFVSSFWGTVQEFAEWDTERQVHEMTFDMLLPNYFRYSYLFLLFLIVEDKLKEIFQITAEKHKESLNKPKN